MMSFSFNEINTLIRMSINPRFKVAKTAINELNDILTDNGAAIAKIASEIAGTEKRDIILKEDIADAYSALFL